MIEVYTYIGPVYDEGKATLEHKHHLDREYHICTSEMYQQFRK